MNGARPFLEVLSRIIEMKETSAKSSGDESLFQTDCVCVCVCVREDAVFICCVHVDSKLKTKVNDLRGRSNTSSAARADVAGDGDGDERLFLSSPAGAVSHRFPRKKRHAFEKKKGLRNDERDRRFFSYAAFTDFF